MPAPAQPDLDSLACVIGEPTRLRMLALLMDGRAFTAKELAYDSGVGPATATVHLRKLREAALVEVTAQGRHKYFRLGSPQVAACVEALMTVAARPGDGNGGPDRFAALSPLRRARFCYDHLAGRLGVALLEALVRDGWLKRAGDGEFAASARGERQFARLGVDLVRCREARRRFAFGCLDWSERRDHLGGALGAALAECFVRSRWLQRRPGSREVTITARGAKGFAREFGLEDLAPSQRGRAAKFSGNEPPTSGRPGPNVIQ